MKGTQYRVYTILSKRIFLAIPVTCSWRLAYAGIMGGRKSEGVAHYLAISLASVGYWEYITRSKRTCYNDKHPQVYRCREELCTNEAALIGDQSSLILLSTKCRLQSFNKVSNILLLQFGKASTGNIRFLQYPITPKHILPRYGFCALGDAAVGCSADCIYTYKRLLVHSWHNVVLCDSFNAIRIDKSGNE